MKKIRIIRSENILSELVTFGETFRIGLPYEDVVKNADLKKFGISDVFKENEAQTPIPAGPRTKANLKGMYVRQQPEVKEETLRHIKYKKKNGTKVEFDRIYNMYKKILLDRLNVSFKFMKDEDGIEFIVSDVLVFNDEFANSKKNTHIINLFLEVFGNYEVIRENLSYFIKTDAPFEREVLPSGERLDDRNFHEFIEFAERSIKERDRKPLIERANVMKEFAPIVRKAPGLNGYLAFIFEEKGIVAAESIRENNATYFFKLQDYEDNLMKDKQEVLNNKLMLKRFYHSQDDRWEKKIRKFLNQH
ncbi:hypothetical protein [Dyadobacter sp. CY347]|jgi:hypothetical protein|uniref:hypothetical protein n=1 Tax=Dyadobacter sp. CY347 TaxID=2909336 RepID=UPI001F2DF83C|nr:hypothetical protein [Dyadobacter sp. CY347]MCF2491694.1 hypothetical protein [Dyadobacter sp. CY347]